MAYELCRVRLGAQVRLLTDRGAGIKRPVRGCVWTRGAGSDSLLRLTAEVGMARRRIGQEDLMAQPEPRTAASLSEI
ncbi:MAG TPA: hypothetical protein VGN83_11750, partial [Falsiroseomonas sp.]|nr:hypothetical protein [Falsiroseomonas sp.]